MLAATLSENIELQNNFKKKGLVWLCARKEPFKIYGIHFDENKGRFLRMDDRVASGFDTVFNDLNADTSGGRLRFVTDSPYIAVFVKQKNNLLLNSITLCGQSGFDLYADNVYVGTFMPKTNARTGFSDIIETPGGSKEYTLNFPLFDNVEELYIGLDGDALVLESSPYVNEDRPIVFYGSSITQGACASRPGNCYTSALCRSLDADYINLGFAARCRGEKKIAEYIAGLGMSAFVLDFDHNVTSAGELREKHFPFYETVRTAHPDIPVVMMSAPDVAVGKPGFAERREVVLESYRKAKDRKDNVFFADGKELYGNTPFDATVDGIHPNDLGFYNMASYLKKIFEKIDIAR